MTLSNKQRKQLKRVIRESIIKEFLDDYGLSSWSGVSSWSGGGGRGKASMSTYGNSLFSIFIDPFVQAGKVIGAELGKTGVRLVGLLSLTIETVLDALVPKFQADYDKIIKTQKKYLDKISEKYKEAYNAVHENWLHEDIQFFSFMHDPIAWLSYRAIIAKPEAALNVYDKMAEGSNTLALYLRDIRNRLFGASVTGQTSTATGKSLPVSTESFKYRARKSLLESDVIHKVIQFQGLDIHIDRPKGFVQTGTNHKGEDWEREYLFDYGFIKGTDGGDEEELDVYVGPNLENEQAYLVTQNKSDGSFDEYKLFVGFDSEEDVIEAYEAHTPPELLDGVDALPIGVIKSLLGLSPLEEAAPTKKRKKTPGEQLADILTSPEFKEKFNKLPIVQDMKADAKNIETQTNNQLKAVMDPVLSATKAQDLIGISGGSFRLPADYNTLDQEDKALFDNTVTSQVKASMATFYQAQLKGMLDSVSKMGINEKSPYVSSLRSMIDKLEPIKQAASREINGKQKEAGSSGSPTKRAQGASQTGKGIYDQDRSDGRGDRSTKGTTQGNLRGVLPITGHKDSESGSEGSEDKSKRRA